MWLTRFLSLERQRHRLFVRSRPGPLRDYLATPFPANTTDCRQIEYLAVDLETTGLNAQQDAIVSMGCLIMRGLAIDLSTARSCLVRQHNAVVEASVLIHRITDDRVAQGQRLEAVMPNLLALLAGRVLLAHHAKIEIDFLSAACERLYGAPLVVPTVDTQWLAQRWFERRGKPFKGKELRLFRLREHYNLPRYRAHDALMDALSVAELFAAQLSERQTEPYLPLREFLIRM